MLPLSLKHEKLISLCANELGLSIRCLEILVSSHAITELKDKEVYFSEHGWARQMVLNLLCTTPPLSNCPMFQAPLTLIKL